MNRKVRLVREDDHVKPDVLYHGSPNEIHAFDDSWCGQHTGDATGAFYFCTKFKVSLDYSISAFKRLYENCIENWCASQMVEDGIILDECEIPEDWSDIEEWLEELAVKHANVVEVYLNVHTPLILEAEGLGIQDVYEDWDIPALIEYINTGQYTVEFNPGFLDDLMDLGYIYQEDPDDEDSEWVEDSLNFDHVVIKNVIDSVGDRSTQMCDVYIVPNPGQINIIRNRKPELEEFSF